MRLSSSRGTFAAAWVLIILGGVAVGAWERVHAGATPGVDPWRVAATSALLVWFGLGFLLMGWLALHRRAASDQQLRRLTAAIEHCPSAVLIVDADDRIRLANRKFCEPLGWSPDEIVGRAWSDFRLPESATTLPDHHPTVRPAGRPWSGEWSHRHRDGSMQRVRGTVVPVKANDGSSAGFVAVSDDVLTAQDREVELREARDRAQAGDRAKSHFLATMSHEVRTPLNGIVGFTSLLLDTPLNSEQREFVQTIRMSTEALIQLTGDILDFARIESGKLKLDPLACDPRECVEDVLDILAPKADAKELELLHHVAPDVPSAILTDGGRLRQVLANLVGNAIKFTDRGEVAVSVRQLIEPPPPGAPQVEPDSCVLEFSVRDTGIGIAPEHHVRLFRAFSQVDESTTRRYGGTGLGLAISRNLVEMMGGTIGLESRPGSGALFRFTVRAPLVTRLPPTRNLAGLRLGLVVETPVLRRELAELVRGWRAEVIEVASPDALTGSDADIVLVEIRENAAREIAARPAPLFGFPSEKLLGLVPVTLSNELRSGLRTHFRLLVNKPVHHDGFYALLAGSMGGLPAPRTPSRYGFRVLLVDDDAINRLLVERVLSNLDCTTTAVESVPLAVARLRQQAGAFDLVMVDVDGPGGEGVSALRTIPVEFAAPPIWIIALTTDAQDGHRARVLAAGLNDFLTKPLRPADLEVALRAFGAHRLPRG